MGRGRRYNDGREWNYYMRGVQKQISESGPECTFRRGVGPDGSGKTCVRMYKREETLVPGGTAVAQSFPELWQYKSKIYPGSSNTMRSETRRSDCFCAHTQARNHQATLPRPHFSPRRGFRKISTHSDLSSTVQLALVRSEAWARRQFLSSWRATPNQHRCSRKKKTRWFPSTLLR